MLTRLDGIDDRAQNQRSVRTILLVAVVFTVLTGCQSGVQKQGPEAEAKASDLANCARISTTSTHCGRKSDLTEVYLDNMHRDRPVRVTVREHSQEADDDTDYAVAEGGHLLIGCGGSGTSFAVVGCEVLKGEAETR